MPNKHMPYTYIVINGSVEDTNCIRKCPNRKRTICLVKATEKGCCKDCEIYEYINIKMMEEENDEEQH